LSVIIKKNIPKFNSSDDQMLEDSSTIKARGAWQISIGRKQGLFHVLLILLLLLQADIFGRFCKIKT